MPRRKRTITYHSYNGYLVVAPPAFDKVMQRRGLRLLTHIKLARLRKKKAGERDKELTLEAKHIWPEEVRKVVITDGRRKVVGDMRASLSTQVTDILAFLREVGTDADTIVEGIRLPIAWFLADPGLVLLLHRYIADHAPMASVQLSDIQLVLDTEAFKTYLENRDSPLPTGLVETNPKSRSLYIDIESL